MAGPEQHVRDVIISFFWRCFPMEPQERAERGLTDDDDVLRVVPGEFGADGRAFGEALQLAFDLPDDVDLQACTVSEAIERVLVHWDRKSFDPEALGFGGGDELAAEDDDDFDDEVEDADDGDGRE